MIETINSLGALWVKYFGIMVLQNSIFLLIVFLSLKFGQSLPARLKYVLALIGLGKLILPPLLPAPFLSYLTPASEYISAQVYPGAMRVLYATQGGIMSLSLAGLFLLVWSFSALVFILLPVISTCKLKKKLSDSTAVPRAEWEYLTGNNIHIFQTERIHLPLSFGLRSSRIYLPAFWKYWSARCQRAVLSHELAHCTRKDGIVLLLQYFIQALYFFHPLVWLLSARLNEYREMACDDQAAASSEVSGIEYSRYLVLLAEKAIEKGFGYTPVSNLMRQKNKLLKRVNYQMKERHMKHASRMRVGIICVSLITLMLPLSWHCTGEKADETTALPIQPEGTIAVNQEPENPQIFFAFDKRPEPIGGMAEIQRNLTYPEEARKTGIEGTVLVQAVIDEGGKVISTKVIKSLEAACDQAAANAIQATRWVPAMQREKAVKVQIAIPVIFRLQGDTRSAEKSNGK